MNAAQPEANRMLAWEGFLAGKLELESRPFKASIEITRNCDLRCVMCPRSWDPRYARRDPDFDMKLELCRPFAGRVRFGLVTNLNRRDPAMWRKLVELGFVIILSCDGATPETFERIRRGGRFENVRENLRIIREARREFGRGRLFFYSVLQTLNYREMPAMVELAARSGADRITFTSVNGDPFLTPNGSDRRTLLSRAKKWSSAAAGAIGLQARLLHPQGIPLGLDRVPAEELERLREQALERGRALALPVIINDAELLGEIPRGPRLEDLGYREGIPDSIRVAAHRKCFKPYHHVAVDYKGDVGPCNYLDTDTAWKQMGSLAGSSFDDIWNAPAYQELRRSLAGGRPDNAGCRWCFARRLAE